MNLNDIQPAIASIRANPIVIDLRSHTYLSTYPHILNIAAENNVDPVQHFYQLAVLVYGWMPRVIRIDPRFIIQSIDAFTTAHQATMDTYLEVEIQHIANCLHSMVGASKLLHFINPNVFPIWDSRIQAFRQIEGANMQNLQHQLQQYLNYISDVHAIIANPHFNDFVNDFNAAYTNRLEESNIDVYQVGAVRSVEAAAFELAP